MLVIFFSCTFFGVCSSPFEFSLAPHGNIFIERWQSTTSKGGLAGELGRGALRDLPEIVNFCLLPRRGFICGSYLGMEMRLRMVFGCHTKSLCECFECTQTRTICEYH